MKFVHTTPRRLGWGLAAAAVLAISGAMGACVQDVGTINRTSPDKIDKRQFEGVWMYVGTVTDAPFSSATAFVGQMNFGDVAKVVFDIQEKFLIAYPVVERVEGTEKDWKLQSIRKYWDPDHRDEFAKMYVGPPVARWSITKHFDLKRNYNSYNGAQSNELTENTTDRPWYERDYIRVDWASQAIPSFFFSLGQSKGMTAYLVSQSHAGEPDSWTMDKDGGYFDYVIRTVVASTGTEYCNTYGLSRYDCAPTEVKVRHSFRRLDPKRDYVPIRYHNNEQQAKFGFFATERYAYDSDWGPTYEGKVQLANRWNIWRNNYDYVLPKDDNGEDLHIACFRDSDCDQDAGFRCQKDESWFADGECSKPVQRPFRERTLRPIVYWLNADWADDFRDAAYKSADSWDDVFKDAVSWRLFYEDKGLGTTKSCETNADCASDSLLAEVDVRLRDGAVACKTDVECGAHKCASVNGTDGQSAGTFCTNTGLACASDAECYNPSCQSGTCATSGDACDTDADCQAPTCGADGFCQAPRRCSAGDLANGVAAIPCAAGQSCQAGVCTVAGEPVSERVSASGTRAATVIYNGAAPLVTHDNFPPSIVSRLKVNPGTAFVRLVNAAPDAGAVSLNVADGSGAQYLIAGGAYDAARDYDPADPATADFLAMVPAGTGLKFTVTSSGNELASVFGDLVANSQYLVIYNGEDVLVTGAALTDTQFGVRLVNMASGEKVDFGLQGVRVDQDVAYRFATDYRNIAGDTQRVTISRAGQRGDFTCYRSDDIGRCVGWMPKFTDEDLKTQEEIKASLPTMFVLCQNQYDDLTAFDAAEIAKGREGYTDARYTVGDYNPCADPALVPGDPTAMKKDGDIRYSMFNWINEAQRSGPLGYGPVAADPDTGEIIYGAANIYGASLRTYAQYALDLLDLVNGDLDTEDVRIGKHTREAVAALAQEQDAEKASYVGAKTDAAGQPTHRPSRLGTLHVDVTTPLGKKAFLNNALLGDNKPDYMFPELVAYQRDPHKLVQDLAASLPQVDPAQFQKRFERVQGTPIESLMINDEVKLAANFIDPDGSMSAEELRSKLTPGAWATKFAMRREAERTARLARENLYMGEFVDDALYGMAKELKEQGLSGDAMRLELGKRITKGVLEHEAGHTMGLRHNFSGSTDVFNYFDGYYSIREKEPIFCQADSWCDDAVGEQCALQNCQTSDDCPAGLICNADDNNVFKCMAPATHGDGLLPTGICAAPVGDQQCATSADCGDGNICDEKGYCFAPNLQFAPRAWMTDNEKAQGRPEYQYSTIMDYGARFNSDLHGLGKYDYAAIRFGYTELVDVYRDTTRLWNRVDQAAQRTGSTRASYSYYVNSEYWANRGTGFWHPFNYLNNYIGVKENLERVPMPYEQVKYQRESVENDVREELDVANVEVPYAYCSDEYRGNMGCYYFDMGADAGEMADNANTQLTQYYLFDAFKRDRLWYGDYGNPMSYYSRIMDRYLRVLGDAGMYYALWDSYLFRYSWYQDWKDMPLGGRMLDRAARDAFGHLIDRISSPAPGCYKMDSLTNSYRLASLDAGEDCDLNVPFGVGRYPYTQFGDSLGYDYWQHPLWFGSFWEKLASLATLTDSTAYFANLYVGEQLNIGVGTSLGFNTVFSDALSNFLGGVVSGDLPFYAGRKVQNTYVGPSVPGKRPCGVGQTPEADDCAMAVEPGLNSFTLKLYAAVYGLAYLPAGFDPAFIDRAAVFVDGEAAQFNHGGQAGVTEHRCADEITGKTYVAYETNYGQYGQPKVDIGVDLVDRCQQYVDAWKAADGAEQAKIEAELQNTREMLDVLRSLHQIYGNSTLGL